MEKKVFMFDFDNTIVKNSLFYWKKTMEKISLKKYGVNVKDKKEILRSKTQNNLDKAKLFLDWTKLDMNAKDVLLDWHKQMEWFYQNKIKLIKGVKEFILSLKKQGKKLIIASATNRDTLEVALKHYEIDVFDDIYAEPDFGVTKKDPDFFEIALKKMGNNAEEVVFFEDSVSSIKSATKVGIDCYALLYRWNKSHKNELKKICKAVIKDYKSKSIMQYKN